MSINNKKELIIGVLFPEKEKGYFYIEEQLSQHYIKTVFISQDSLSNYTNNDNEVKEVYNKIEALIFDPALADNINYLKDSFPNLKWIQGIYAGVDMFFPYFPLFKQNNWTLTNVKGVFSAVLGEFVIASIMYFEKNLNIFHETKKQKEWKRCSVNMLEKKTIGIIGYGNIGVEVAKRAKLGFNMNTLAFKNNINKCEGKEYVDELIDNDHLNELLGKSDYIVSILPLTDTTLDFFNKEKFLKMKKDSIFINIGRGKNVVESDLIEVLKEKTTIKAACLDVTYVEPLPKDSPLWELENVFISNHSGDVVDDGLSNLRSSYDLSIKGVVEFCNSGKIINNVIDLDKGY